jgi:membrane-bound metal-dependent hydrolase YbcI (DUF457 family)
MKNIAHFATGLLAASFIPGVMEDAARGSLLVALGGACAMLPDTLDFKLARYLERRDAEISPDPTQPDPQVMADAISTQMQLALSQQCPRVVQLHPLRRGVADWLLYTVCFDVAHGDVVVRMDQDGSEGRAHVGNIDYTYEGNLHVEELGGPSLHFSASGPNVRVEFLPYHRAWTHSLVIALGLGMLLGLLLDPRAGVVAALGYAAHVLGDQLGYMGSNLFAPFTRGRGKGLGLFHSGDAIPNIVTVWLSLTLILLNMDRVRAAPLISTGPYLAFVVLLVPTLLTGIYARRRWRKHLSDVEALRQRELIAQTEELPF